jgi:hypothetical protein
MPHKRPRHALTTLADVARPMRVFVVVVLLAILGVGGWATYTYVRHTNHQDACQRYDNALTAVLTDFRYGIDAQTMAVLSPSDQSNVRTARQVFNKTLNKPNTDADRLMSNWKIYTGQFHHEALVRQGC